MTAAKSEEPKLHAINLRRVSDELYWRIKERAAQNRKGVEEYVTLVLEEATKPKK